MQIEYLKIFSKDIGSQRHFYETVLGLPVKQVSAGTLEIQVGFSILEISYSRSATPYHIAFHITDRQEEQALEWLKPRVDILKDGGKEIIDFPAWNARSVYFYDEGRNIMEFISREQMYRPEEEVFSAKSIVGISEIGLATTNVKEAFNFLNTRYGLPKFTGDHEVFCATGDDEGLFIIINKNKKDWFPVGDEAFSSPFEIHILTANQRAKLAYKDEDLRLI